MSADVYDDTVVVETESFSYYTVEFTYGDMEYVLPGDSTVALSDILSYVGLQGDVSAASVSNSSLFNAYQDGGVWYVSANGAFDTEEWMVVTIDGIDYSITVTDAATVQMHIGSQGFDPQGANPTLRTTYNDGGYLTAMQDHGYSNRVNFTSFAFGKVYTQGTIEASLSYSVSSAGNALIVTYTMTNTSTEDAVTLMIGSAADTQVGTDTNADHCDVGFTENGLSMTNASTGNQFYLIPGNGSFSHKWVGKYSGNANGSSYQDHIFDNGNVYSTNDDSALAYSWEVIVPAGGTVTRVAIFTAGNNLTTYQIAFNANGGSGTMNNATFVSQVPGSLPPCSYTRPNYTFMGWATSQARANANTIDYQDQGQITVSGNTTLYAVWLPSANVIVPPTIAQGLVYNGSAQNLLATPGSCDYGQMVYSIDTVSYSTTIPTRTDAGTYTVWYRSTGDGTTHGPSTPVALTVTISPATPQVTPPAAITGLSYTGSAQTLITAGSTDVGEMVYSLSQNGTYSTTLPTGTNAGTYTVWYKVPGSSNYSAYGPYSLTVNIAKVDSVLTAPPTARTLTFNGNQQALVNAGTATGGSVVYSLSASGPWSTTVPTQRNAGDYTVYYKVQGDSNHNDVPGGQIPVTISRANASIVADDLSKVYGTADPQLTTTRTGEIASEPLVYNISREDGENVGSYVITVSANASDNPNYNVTIDPRASRGVFRITQASVTITPNNLQKVYGADDPALTATVTGVVSGDSLNYTLSRSAGENVGTYTISVSPGVNPNYTVTVRTGTFTIGRASATITANNLSKIYGENDPELTVRYTGLVNGDTELDYTITRAAGENVGEYTITVTAGNNPNYEVSVATGTLTIRPAAATITAVNKTKVYGSNDPALTVIYSGLVNGDTALNYSIARATGENVGEYAITVTAGNNPNYNVTVVNGTFTITPAAATITAVDNSKVYGSADPTFSVTFSGLVNGDTSLAYTIGRAEGEDVGTYAITATPGDNPNYTVTSIDGVFTITPANATISAVDNTKVYGQDDPALEVSYTGLVNGDTDLDYTIARVAGENVGTYEIAVTNGTNPNYNVTVVPGTFTITPANATISAVDNTKVYGQDDPALEVSYTGLVNGDTELDYTIVRAQGEDVGDYTITVTAGNNPNYNVSVEEGTFTITPAPATITADDITRTYGDADPALTVTYEGLQRGDTDLDYSIAREAGENVGDYVITVTPGTNPNYDVSVVDGTFTIVPAPATITAVDNTKVYGSDDPAFEVTFSGLVNGDTELDYTIARAAGENAGTYEIAVTNGTNPNYDVTVVSGTFTITPADATIIANNHSKTYGESDPAFTVRFDGLVNGDTELNYTIARAEGEDAGEYIITVTPGANPNYTVSTVSGTFTIRKADPIVTAPIGLDHFLDGESHPLFEEGSTTGGTLQYSLDGVNYATGVRTSSREGTYTIWYRVLGDNNYNDVAPAFITATIVEARGSGDGSSVPMIVDGETVIIHTGEPIPVPAAPSRYGYDFDGWYADEACTIPIDPNTIVGHEGIQLHSRWAAINYTLIEGAEGEWYESDDHLAFRAVRNRAEETTFSHYMNVYVDGNLLSLNDYVAESGSVIIRLNPAFLATLAIGEHTLDIEFDDAPGVRTIFYILGDASARDRIVNASDSPVASTGEDFNIRVAMIISMLFAASGACAFMAAKFRKDETEE
ncbi:MAG: InlB B-repeat-containing protein [Clostridiales bacterium]|nr:InlB B-repeat-containing protein [Clostridiales bacterium]